MKVLQGASNGRKESIDDDGVMEVSHSQLPQSLDVDEGVTAEQPILQICERDEIQGEHFEKRFFRSVVFLIVGRRAVGADGGRG